jgi:hypothetical protein
MYIGKLVQLHIRLEFALPLCWGWRCSAQVVGWRVPGQRRGSPAGLRSLRVGARSGLYHRPAMPPSSLHHTLCKSHLCAPASFALAVVASHNKLLVTDAQQQVAASRRVLRAGQLRR